MSVQYTGGVQYSWNGKTCLVDVTLSVKSLITLYNVCAVHWGDIMSTAGVFSTLGGTMTSVGGYHEYSGGCSVHCGFHTNSIVFPMTFPTFIMISPGVLMISPQCTHDIPHCTHDILRCTEHPPLYCTDIVHFETSSILIRCILQCEYKLQKERHSLLQRV